jgi:hypothetical protein
MISNTSEIGTVTAVVTPKPKGARKPDNMYPTMQTAATVTA